MKFKTIVLWWLVTEKEPTKLDEEDKRIKTLMPLLEALFPGIDYFSTSGFGNAVYEFAVPAIKERFPELRSRSEESISPEEMSEIAPFLPSNGYEWQDDPEWEVKFMKLLSTHPDQLEGEVFFTNANENGFAHIGWKTKRRGRRAFNVVPSRGTKAEDYFPVFVQRAEIEAESPETLVRLGVRV